MIKSCCICEKNHASYKCPACKKSYCSVACCKEHKNQICNPAETPEEHKQLENTNVQEYKFPTEDTVPVEKLQQLRHSEELRQCLKNPYVRDMMKAILNNPNPTATIALAMTEPIFVEMADACLKIVEPPDENKPC